MPKFLQATRPKLAAIQTKHAQTKRATLLAAGLGFLLVGQAHAAEVQLRPEGTELARTLEALLAELAPEGSGLELKLTTAGSGPRVVWGNESGVPFNPDLVARSSGRGSNRLIELNPAGPLNRAEALRQVLQSEFELSEWNPEAARLRFSGADLNADGRVDLTDLALMMEAYGGTGRGDLDGNRRVDRADLELFGNSYRVIPLEVTPPASEPPASEPQPTPKPPEEVEPQEPMQQEPAQETPPSNAAVEEAEDSAPAPADPEPTTPETATPEPTTPDQP